MTHHFKRIGFFFLTIAMTALMGCASTSGSEGTGEYNDDTAITAKTTAAIFNQPTL